VGLSIRRSGPARAPYFLCTPAGDGDLGGPLQRLLSREGTSTTENPPTTALVSGYGAFGDRPVGGHDARALTYHSAAENPHAGVLGLLHHLVRRLGHVGQLLLGEGHRAVIERDQVSRHLMAPCPGGLLRRLVPLLRTRSGSDRLPAKFSKRLIIASHDTRSLVR
jgi:hypothetical protein